MNISKDQYVAQCRLRWHGQYLRDAIHNWHYWEGMRDTLVEAMREFHRNPGQVDINGTWHNPNGTLTSFLWKLQTTIQPDRSRLAPFLDFNDDSQTCFLRRGLIFYCTLILRELEKPEPVPEGQKVMQLE
jgi:hypothetical protein